nr:MAG TPA: hypothetical protein [Caudoviricetes sp.]
MYLFLRYTNICESLISQRTYKNSNRVLVSSAFPASN